MIKKVFVLFCSIFLSFSFLAAQNSVQQILIPRTIFVGDTAELKITFFSSIDFMNNEKNQFDTKELSINSFERALDNHKFMIKKITLTKRPSSNAEQYSYDFSILFTPWVTSEILIPPYNLALEFPESSLNDFYITPSSFAVDSILMQKNVNASFVKNKAPLLLPGTIYKIYFQIILFVILVIVIIRMIVKHKQISFFMKNLRLRILYWKNKNDTIKKLNSINLNSKSDKENACDIQIVMRDYLQTRFDYPFKKCMTSEIANGFDKIFLGTLSEKKEQAVVNLCSVFSRTDFIRYSKISSFNKNEKQELIENLLEIISTLENVNKTSSEVQEGV